MPTKAVRRRISLAVISTYILLLTAIAAQAQNDASDGVTAIAFLIVFLVIIAFYFVPTFVAFARNHSNRWLILVINAAFGATGLGWVGSLVWACHAAHRSNWSDGGESGLNLFVNDRPTKSPTKPPIDELERLKALLDAGAIDLDDYQRVKKRLLRS